MSVEATERPTVDRRSTIQAPASLRSWFRSWRHVAGLTAAGAIVLGGFAAPVFAENDGVTTWSEVVAAQGNVDRQQQLIADIQAEISSIDGRLASATATATAAGERYSTALTASNNKAGEVTILQQQATDAQSTADESRIRAGQLAATMSSRGGTDPTLTVFMHPENADSLLYQLGTISKLSGQTNGIYNDAVALQNTATALGEQANAALGELKALEADAKTEFDAAQATQISLQSQKNQADARRAELQAMLVPLIEARNVTATDYAASEQLRMQQLAQENANRAAAAAAAQQQAYQQALAEAEAAGVAPPPAPEIPAQAPPLVVPADVETNPDGTLARPPAAPAAPAAPVDVPTTTPAEPSASAAPELEPTQPAPDTPAPEQPSQPAPVVPVPVDPAPEQPAPVVPVPVEPAPEQPAPVVPVPVDPAPEQPAPVVPVPVDPAPEQPTEPTPPAKPDIEPYVPPARPDIEVVPEPEPTPEPAPEPEPSGPAGVRPGYFPPFTKGVVTDEYGMRFHPILGYSRMHNGLDLGVPGGTCGAPLHAVSGGVVTYAGANGGYGNFVKIDIGGGVEVAYAHIMNGGINVYVGQQVSAGDVIAYAGTTGLSTGCHLHFEVTYFGQFMDPKPWLANMGIFYY